MSVQVDESLIPDAQTGSPISCATFSPTEVASEGPPSDFVPNAQPDDHLRVSDIDANDMARELMQTVEDEHWQDLQAEADDDDELLAQAAKQGFTAQGVMGSRFTRYMTRNPEAKKEYNSLKGRDQKAEFRKRWAKETYEAMETGKRQEQIWKQVDTSHGDYLLPKDILEEQGGPNDPEASQATKTLMSRCMKLGKPFVIKNVWASFGSRLCLVCDSCAMRLQYGCGATGLPAIRLRSERNHTQSMQTEAFTDRLEFLRFKRSRVETFENAWQQYQKWSSKTEAKDPEKKVVLKQQKKQKTVSETQQTTGSPDIATPQQASGKGTKRKAQGSSKKTEKPAKSSKTMLASLKQHQSDCCQGMAQAKQLQENISQCPEWAWARNMQEDLAELDAAVEEVKVSMQHPFLMELQTFGIENMKYSEEDLAKNMGLLEDMRAKLAKVAKPVRTLTAMHRSRSTG